MIGTHSQRRRVTPKRLYELKYVPRVTTEDRSPLDVDTEGYGPLTTLARVRVSPVLGPLTGPQSRVIEEPEAKEKKTLPGKKGRVDTEDVQKKVPKDTTVTSFSPEVQSSRTIR